MGSLGASDVGPEHSYSCRQHQEAAAQPSESRGDFLLLGSPGGPGPWRLHRACAPLTVDDPRGHLLVRPPLTLPNDVVFHEDGGHRGHVVVLVSRLDEVCQVSALFAGWAAKGQAGLSLPRFSAPPSRFVFLCSGLPAQSRE